jgi:acyl transferase domain-containing protein
MQIFHLKIGTSRYDVTSLFSSSWLLTQQQIPRKLEPWPEEYVRRASINNFGYGGANAHVIMEAWEPYLSSTMRTSKVSALLEPPRLSSNVSTVSSYIGNAEDCFDREENIAVDTPTTNNSSVTSDLVESSMLKSRVLLLSAKDEVVAQKILERLRDYLTLSNMEDEELINRLAHTLGNRRSKFPWRIAFPSPTTKVGLLLLLNDPPRLAPTRSTKVPRLGFVFTGQGAQWYAMGRELIEVYPVFLATLQEANNHLQDMDCTWDLIGKVTFF